MSTFKAISIYWSSIQNPNQLTYPIDCEELYDVNNKNNISSAVLNYSNTECIEYAEIWNFLGKTFFFAVLKINFGIQSKQVLSHPIHACVSVIALGFGRV